VPYQVNVDEFRKAGYINRLNNKDYINVAGRVWASHDACQLIGLSHEHWSDDDWFYCKTTATILNSHIPGFENFPDEFKFGTFQGTSRASKNDGKSAEKTNPLEVCETSSTGRALGFAGFAIPEGIASSEEIANARAIEAAQKEAAAANAPTQEQKDELKKILGSRLSAEVEKRTGKKVQLLTKDDAAALLEALTAEGENPQKAPF